MSRAIDHRPAFLVTMDTEGDRSCSEPQRIETRNAVYVPRFAVLPEQRRFKPTYLTDYEMSERPELVSFTGGLD